jgi:hypothetical protein
VIDVVAAFDLDWPLVFRVDQYKRRRMREREHREKQARLRHPARIATDADIPAGSVLSEQTLELIRAGALVLRREHLPHFMTGVDRQLVARAQRQRERKRERLLASRTA